MAAGTPYKPGDKVMIRDPDGEHHGKEGTVKEHDGVKGTYTVELPGGARVENIPHDKLDPA